MTPQAEHNLNTALGVMGAPEKLSFASAFCTGASERCIETPWAASQLRAGERVLDIGYTMSSLDYLGVLLAARRDLQIDLTAVDIVRPQRVQTRYPESWLDEIFSVPVTIGDIREIELPNGHFDLITCISTIEHVGFDEAAEDGDASAFIRPDAETKLTASRAADVTAKVLAKFHRLLRPGGRLLISTPMGQGGATALRDSLGLYTKQWEYDADSWREIVEAPGFSLTEQRFFRCSDEGVWSEAGGPEDLRDRSSYLRRHAFGCALAALQKENVA